MHNELTQALKAIIECETQAPNDLVGEQREFYLPRLATAMSVLCSRLPAEAIAAMESAT